MKKKRYGDVSFFYAANKIDLHGGGGLQERGNVV